LKVWPWLKSQGSGPTKFAFYF